MQPDIGKYQISASGNGAIIAPGEVQAGAVEVDETKAFINNLFSEGKYDEAGPHLAAMLKTADDGKDLSKKAWSLHQMGIRAFCMGHKAEARGYWKESLKIKKSLKDVNGAAVTNYHLRLVRPSLPLHQRVIDRIGEIGARVLVPLGVVVTGLIFASTISNRQTLSVGSVSPTPSLTPAPSPVQDDVVKMTLPVSPVVAPQTMASPAAIPLSPTPGAAPKTAPTSSTPASVTPPPVSAPAPVITISPRRIHFAGAGEQIITLANNGPIHVTNLKVSWINNPGVFKASLNCADLNVGQQCRLSVRYSGSSAPSSAALNIGYDGGEITMPMGPGIHGMTTAPKRLAFSDQVVNSSATSQTVTITNRSTEEFEVREIVVPARMFWRKPHFTASQDCERKIAPGTSCVINVNFAPSEEGAQKSELRITVRPAGGGEALPLPPVALIGKGIRQTGAK
ncbi:MAG TPA: choice-of-anchor D domain-containing protein [Blastocatellia bacterium]|nr:choice-of-anchor D domain-containing protein [Blastocatellia bacterium]